MAKIKHDLADHDSKVVELLGLGVPQTRVAKRFGVTIEQLRYFLRQKKNSDPKAAE